MKSLTQYQKAQPSPKASAGKHAYLTSAAPAIAPTGDGWYGPSPAEAASAREGGVSALPNPVAAEAASLSPWNASPLTA